MEEDKVNLTTDIINKPEEKISNEDLIEYYKTFSNSMVYGPILYNGMKLILDKMVAIELRITKIEEKLYGSN